ncbi:MAG: ABC-2 family transporter protein [Bacilli bacterium]|nr:ABC-2 family transporter protein [Bacilli bacterium]
MKLLLHYFSMHIKVYLEYKMNFFLTMIAQVLILGTELFAVYTLFDKFELLEEFNVNYLFLVFAINWLGFSLAETFGRGFDEFKKLMKKGGFDILLIRPRNIFLQILGNEFALHKIGRVIASFYLLVVSVINLIPEITLDKILLVILMVLGDFTIIVSLFIFGAFFVFFTVEGLEFINVFTNGTKQVNEYPISLYHKAVGFIFTFIIPIALCNYYPIEYLVNNSNSLIYFLMPFASLIILGISVLVFNLGLKHYSSTGS